MNLKLTPPTETNAHDLPRTLVHADPIVLRREGGTRTLVRYLRDPGPRDLMLVHQGEHALRSAARAAGVDAIRNEPSVLRTEADAASALALELGAPSIEYTIDERGLRSDAGACAWIHELTDSEAERLVRRNRFSKAIREKLLAAVRAVRAGLRHVRIGSPSALWRGRATVIVPDPEIPLVSVQLPPNASPSLAEVVGGIAATGSLEPEPGRAVASEAASEATAPKGPVAEDSREARRWLFRARRELAAMRIGAQLA